MRHTTVFGTFAIEPMPGQPQVGLCHGFFVPIKQRGRGFAHRLKTQQAQLLQADNYDYAIATVAGDNLAQQRVLEKAGWSMLVEFNNSKSGGVTQIWGAKVTGAT